MIKMNKLKLTVQDLSSKRKSRNVRVFCLQIVSCYHYYFDGRLDILFLLLPTGGTTGNG